MDEFAKRRLAEEEPADASAFLGIKYTSRSG